jgi:regulator of sirC expression with transglutaminase-like and TPR domain
MPQPLYCRADAYVLFRAQMPVIDTIDGLLRAAIAMSMHELRDVTPEAIDREINRYADAIRSRVRSASPKARLAHLHAVLFDEAGFVGNSEDYYNPHNSYISTVLQTKRGLPITLTLLYKAVAERCGLRVSGINAPLHFMAGVEADGQTLLIDPFFGGRYLSRQEAFDRIEELSGRVVPRVDEMLPKANHRQWIGRMLQNLMHIFEHEQRRDDYKAMLELRGVLMTEH